MFTTERLLIRNIEKKDWISIYEYTSNPEVMKYMSTGVLNEDETINIVMENIGDKAEKFAIVLKENNRLIGHIEFFQYFGSHTYEIGWVLNPDYINKGLATEAARGFLEYGFNVLKLHRIVATCQPENIPSYRVMEKIGMRREGYFKKCIPHGDIWWDEYYYAVLREEYLN
ncbi:GNAT family N-acetyltransferase [Cytobacillus purgationiresistens]|uniref:GNAT family N-acetyltransferase n=1 Tax=Cytobacillus purgationiresistens TaxID=863449 RepID=UPI0027D91D6B|nr:GNAT family N-acetyltransferase [Cytobacillus purgationiresistens]